MTSIEGRQPNRAAAIASGAAPTRLPREPRPMKTEVRKAKRPGSAVRAKRNRLAMKIGAQPMPISAMASVPDTAPVACANRKAPALPTAMAAVTVRRGPSRSSAQPIGNCAIAKVVNQAAPSRPNSPAPIARSLITGWAITLRNDR